jgi:hypothetical protein
MNPRLLVDQLGSHLPPSMREELAESADLKKSA